MFSSSSLSTAKPSAPKAFFANKPSNPSPLSIVKLLVLDY